MKELTIESICDQLSRSEINEKDAFNLLEKYLNENSTLEQAATSKEASANYCERFSYSEPYLRDHLVLGKRVLLGITYCSLAIEAFRNKYPQKQLTGLQKFTWIEPVVFSEGDEVEISVDIEKGGTQFNIHYRFLKNGASGSVAKGVYLIDSLPVGESFLFEPSTSPAKNILLPQQIYNPDKPVAHFSSLHTLKKVSVMLEGNVGELRVTPQMLEIRPPYFFNPAIIDGIFTCSLAGKPELESQPYVPFYIQEIMLTGSRIPDSCHCITKINKISDKMLVFDAQLYDNDQKLLAVINGATCKKVDRDIFSNTASDHASHPSEAFHPQFMIPEKEVTPMSNPLPQNQVSLKKSIEKYLQTKIASSLLVTSNEVSTQLNFMELGLDSVQLVGMAKEIESDIQIELYPTLFFEYPNIQDLAAYFETEHASEFSQYVKGNEPPILPESVPTPVLAQTSQNQTSLNASIEKYLQTKIASSLLVTSNEVSTQLNFMELGLDSVQLVGMAKEIESDIQIELYPTLFFEYPNIQDLAAYFATEHANDFSNYIQKNLSHRNNFAAIPTVMPELKADVIQNRPTQDVEVKNSVLNHPIANAGGNPNQLNSDEHNMDDDIAVIGMSGMFPHSENLEQFSENILNKFDFVEEVPSTHWDHKPWFDGNGRFNNKMYCKWGGFIDDFDKFDAKFFNISSKEAISTDPQARLLMQTLYAAVEDAGYGKDIRGSSTGIYVGSAYQDYAQNLIERHTKVNPYHAIGNSNAMLANRISYFLNLHGPSLTLDTTCSSSLVALHLACQALRRKECETALVAGVNLILSPHHYLFFCALDALSPSGRCHTFDEAADGYVPSEAVAAVMLKPLSKALADGDQIHAVIKGTAVQHGGHTQSITAPSVTQETEVILKAWQDAKIDPLTINYIEAHGTGTKLGDPIEIQAIKNAFAKHTNKSNFCAVGSLKAHMGHAEAAAGIASLIKVILCMKQKRIAAMPKFKQLNPYIDLTNSALYINQEMEEWKTVDDKPRRAGINSFGFGGTYAHVVVEEFAAKNPQAFSHVKDIPSSEKLFLLSAKDLGRLKEHALNLKHYLAKNTSLVQEGNKINQWLTDIAYTLQVGREDMDVRLAVIADSVMDLQEKLDQFLNDKVKSDKIFLNNKDQQKLNMLFAGRPGQVYLQALLEEKSMHGLAELWLMGARIDWRLLYGAKPPGKISLPTYPFAKERYWYDLEEDDHENLKVNSNKPLESTTNLGIEKIDPPHLLIPQDLNDSLIEVVIHSLGNSIDTDVQPSTSFTNLGFTSIERLSLWQLLSSKFPAIQQFQPHDVMSLDSVEEIADFLRQKNISLSQANSVKTDELNLLDDRVYQAQLVTAPSSTELDSLFSNTQLRLIHSVKFDLSSNILEGIVKINPNDPFYFDHFYDHVPGILLIECIHQMANIAMNRLIPNTGFRVTACDTFFTNWVNMDSIKKMTIHHIHKKESDYVLKGNMSELNPHSESKDCMAFVITIATVGSFDEPTVFKDQKPLKPCAKNLAHKRNLENVLITKPKLNSKSEYFCNTLYPAQKHSLAGGIKSNYLSLTYLVEIARQFSTALSHMAGNIKEADRGILLSLHLSIQSEVLKDMPIKLVCASDIQTDNIKEGHRIDIGFQSNNKTIGNLSLFASITDVEKYLEKRGDEALIEEPNYAE